MADLNAAAKEVFQVLRSFDYTVRSYDDTGMAVTEPEDARRMLVYPRNLMVSLLDDDDNSRITLSIGKSTHVNDIMGLNQQLRTLATKYNLIFKARQYGKVISPKNFSELASITEDIRMHVLEGMYGTSRSSYLRLENARMIVRHKNRIDDSMIGARGRHVESIFVENAVGERGLLPTTNLMAGRAMTQHVNQGGAFADPIAEQINGMAKDYGNLGIGVQAAVSESASIVREACRTKMGKLRKTFERLARPNSYATEAADMAKVSLNETSEPITETRINELRQLLNGDRSDAVYESCCKAIDEMKATVTEGRPRAEDVPMLSVVGHPVTVSAWNQFKQRVLMLKAAPTFERHGFGNLMDEICYRLSQLVPVVKDDSMANLLDAVADRWPEETDKMMRDKYRTIAVTALRAVGGMPQGRAPLADKNSAVIEYVDWLNCFDSDRVLTEDGWSPMDPSFPHDLYDNASENAIRDFDPEEFAESPEMLDTISGRDPKNPEENHLMRDEIISALEAYLRHYIEMYNPDIGGYDDMAGMADAVYDQAVQALHQRGFVITNTTGLEEEEEFTKEDVLLPKHNQGHDLAGEVTKADVASPDEPDQHGAAGEQYTSRLMTLAGMNTGQGY